MRYRSKSIHTHTTDTQNKMFLFLFRWRRHTNKSYRKDVTIAFFFHFWSLLLRILLLLTFYGASYTGSCHYEWWEQEVFVRSVYSELLRPNIKLVVKEKSTIKIYYHTILTMDKSAAHTTPKSGSFEVIKCWK